MTPQPSPTAYRAAALARQDRERARLAALLGTRQPGQPDAGPVRPAPRKRTGGLTVTTLLNRARARCPERRSPPPGPPPPPPVLTAARNAYGVRIPKGFGKHSAIGTRSPSWAMGHGERTSQSGRIDAERAALFGDNAQALAEGHTSPFRK